MNEPVKKDTITREFCSSCGGERNCDILGSYNQVSSYDSVEFYTDWFILKCRGCDTVFCQTKSYCSEDFEYYDDHYGPLIISPNKSIKYWPSPAKRKKPDWYIELHTIDGLQEKLINPLDELYGALDANLPMLSGIAFRLCFDIIAELLEIDPQLTFKDKLNALVENGKLGISNKETISALIEAGHAATHRGWIPNPEELNTLFDILEPFIRETLVEPTRAKRLADRAKKLKEKVPARTRKDKLSNQNTPDL